MPRSDSKPSSPRRRASSNKPGSRAATGNRSSGGGARTRARERALRKSGEVGVSHTTLVLGILGIFVLGLAAGGAGGLYLERAGLLSPELSGPTLAEVDGPEVVPGLDADVDPDAEGAAVAAVAPAAGSAADSGTENASAPILAVEPEAEPADLPPTGNLSAFASTGDTTVLASIEAEPLVKTGVENSDGMVLTETSAENREIEQTAARPSKGSAADASGADASGADASGADDSGADASGADAAETDSIAEAILAFDPAADAVDADAAADHAAVEGQGKQAEEGAAVADDVAAAPADLRGDADPQVTPAPKEMAGSDETADPAPAAPDAPALTEVAALEFPPLPRPREASRREPDLQEPFLVYEEPVRLSDLLPPPSDAELDAFVEEAGLAAKPVAPVSSALPWQRHAVQVSGIGNRPMIALVIDDLGLNRPNARKVAALPGPLTLAFMTYAEGIEGILERARDAGHELMVHMPMEPSDPRYDPGPNVLRSEMKAEELKRRIDWGLRRFDGYVGINNHMGSKFTTSMEGMAVVMETLQRRGLLYLDSVTAGGSVGAGLAERTGVPFAVRDVFIDNDYDNPDAIRRQLAEAERIALRRGYAIAIGHPHRTTIAVLTDWLSGLEARGFALVPVSAVVQRRIEIAGGNGDAG